MIALAVVFPFLSSCSTTGGLFGGGGRLDPVVETIIDVGAAGIALQYPQYAREIQALAGVLRGNADSAAIREIANGHVESFVTNEALKASLMRLIDRVVDRSTPNQQPEAMDQLAEELMATTMTMNDDG